MKSKNYEVISNANDAIIKRIKVPKDIEVVPTYNTVRIKE